MTTALGNGSSSTTQQTLEASVMGKAIRKALKDQNRSQLWVIMAANAVAFYCVAQWDSISSSGIESLFKHAANLLPVGLTIILTTVANALISSGNKARLVFMRWHHALPGHRAFSEYEQSDPRVDM